MTNFEKIYELVERSSHETAFNKEEARELFKILLNLNSNSSVVEIGIQFGRSTTVIGSVAKEIGFTFFAIDNWQEGISAEAKEHVQKVLIEELSLPIKIINEDSKIAWKSLPEGMKIDVLHIDGHHSYKSVLSDCNTYLPLVKVGGTALFDDYEHAGVDGVKKGVMEFMNKHNEYWRFVGKAGNKLGIFKRI